MQFTLLSLLVAAVSAAPIPQFGPSISVNGPFRSCTAGLTGAGCTGAGPDWSVGLNGISFDSRPDFARGGDPRNNGPRQSGQPWGPPPPGYPGNYPPPYPGQYPPGPPPRRPW